MSVIKLEDKNFDELIKEGVVLVDFYAEWCGPCKMIAPILDMLAPKREEKIVKVNVDAHPDIADRFSVMSIPTLKLFKNGEEVGTKLGFQTAEAIEAWLDEVK